MRLFRLGTASAVYAILALTGAPALADESPVGVDTCNASSLDSKPGRAWDEAYGWRYNTSRATDPEKRKAQNLANRTKAYTELVTGQSPWPDWFKPTVTALPAGTRFQMAMSKGQGNDQPGGFGTFDDITSVNEVREDLAVLQAWKPDVDRVNTYATTDIMLVHVGPIGPQVDPEACALLPGRFSQFEMLVPRSARIDYIQFVSSHPLEQDE